MSAAENVQTNDGSEAALQADVAALTAERDKLVVEKADLHDLLLRHQAEFNNFRRRTERDRSDFVQYAGMELVRELLPVLDDFERALQADSGSKDYAKGVELIYQRMYDSLKKIGLEPIDTTGKIFDPHLHQAVEKALTNDAEDHAILSEFQRGYHFKGKLLRPSMVKVAVRS
ncbi:MAG: nucleotide exchange factor GrpE [Acidobacteriota bacterium]|nr:nucleotide exchange factor GrpE [Acidobacteriota bacterium]